MRAIQLGTLLGTFATALLFACAPMNASEAPRGGVARQAGPLAFTRVEGTDHAPGDSNLLSPSRGVLQGVFTFDDACALGLSPGRYELTGDSLFIFIFWPPLPADRLCVDAIIPETYAFRIEDLPPGTRQVVFFDVRPGEAPRQSTAYPPRSATIR